MLIDSRDPETRERLNLDALPPYGVKPRPEGDRVVYVVWNFKTDTLASGIFPDRSDAFIWMDKLNAVAKAGLKVYDMDDCTWYAAVTVEDAKRQYIADMGEESWDFDEGYPRELDDEEMARLEYVADPYKRPEDKEPFRNALAHMLAEGKEFPRFFATTEY